MTTKRTLKWIGITIAALVAAYIVYVLFYTHYGVKLTHISVSKLTIKLESLGVLGQCLAILLVYTQTVFPFVPFVVVASVTVALFGLWGGLLVNWTMSCLGAMTAFLIARHFAYNWVGKRLTRYPQLEAFNDRLEKHSFIYITISRVIPVLPSIAINLSAAIMKVSFRSFMLGTIVGKLPMTFLESMIGHDLLHFKQHKDRLLLLLVLFAILIYLGSLFKKRLSGNK